MTPYNKWEWKNEFVTINHVLKFMSQAYIDEDNVEIRKYEIDLFLKL